MLFFCLTLPSLPNHLATLDNQTTRLAHSTSMYITCFFLMTITTAVVVVVVVVGFRVKYFFL